MKTLRTVTCATVLAAAIAGTLGIGTARAFACMGTKSAAASGSTTDFTGGGSGGDRLFDNHWSIAAAGALGLAGLGIAGVAAYRARPDGPAAAPAASLHPEAPQPNSDEVLLVANAADLQAAAEAAPEPAEAPEALAASDAETRELANVR